MNARFDRLEFHRRHSAISKILIRCLLPLWCLAVLEPGWTQAASSQPNIILIITDDQGYGDLGVTGNPVIETPHMDALAKQSASLKTFYVMPVCSPTRAGLMTGRYHYRTRVVDTFKGRSMMEPNETTLAEVLRLHGYRTGIFGKWHLGDCYPMRPGDQGFEESLVHRGGGLAQPSEPIENRNRYTDPLLFRNGELVQAKGYCTDVYFDAAMEFMDQSARDGQPFFVYLPPNAPHGPYQDVPEDLHEKYRAKDLEPVLLGNEGSADTVARVYAMIENIDWNVGRLDRKLREAGWMENTIVLLMFDNGPNTRRYVGPLRGMKSEVHEGGIRSPFFMRWPARLQPGLVSERVGAYIDVMPTLLDAAGVGAPAGTAFDGRSLLPLLEGDDAGWEDRSLFIQAHRGDAPVRYHHMAIRNQRWKLLHPTGFQREEPDADVPWELYDMPLDPGEKNNVAERHPEVVRSLRAEYDAWFDRVAGTRPDNFQPPRIVAGTDNERVTVLTWQDWKVTEGGGWGKQGRWRLRFHGYHAYDVELKWPAAIEIDEVVLHIGSTERAMAVGEITNHLHLDNVAAPEGEADLWVEVRSGDRTEGPYHVVLTRRH